MTDCGGAGVTIGANRTLRIGSANTSTTFAGNVAGSGSLEKIGTGTLTLLNQGVVLGGTTVSAGKLVKADWSGAIAVANGAILQGIGTTGAITVANGGTLVLGSSTGTLTTTSLTLSPGATMIFEFDTPGASDLILVNGPLVLDGSLVAVNGASMSAGTYRVLNYTGALTNNGLEIASMPPGSTGVIDVATAGQVNLVVEGNPAPPPPPLGQGIFNPINFRETTSW